MDTPITTEGPALSRRVGEAFDAADRFATAARFLLLRGLGLTTSASCMGAGVSASTSRAALSSRNALKAA
jgi:hypothetical protein